MMKNLFLVVIFLILIAGGWYYFKLSDQLPPWSFSEVATSTEEAVALANPASVNCEQLGGELIIETRPDAGEFGVCYFSDNHQCEEWAMYRGECIEGGIDVMNYREPEARYCAITGGVFKNDICTLADNKKCDAGEYFAGRCPAGGTNGH